MKFQIRERNKVQIGGLFVIVALICCLLNHFGIIDFDVLIMSFILIIIFSFLTMCFVIKLFNRREERLIVSIGYIARIVLLYIDIYGKKYFVLMGSGADSEGFWLNALNRYRGIPQIEYTKYPYILQAFMQMFGEDRLMVQYMNIIFWLLTMLVVYKSLLLLEVNENAILIALCFLAFMPQYMILTAILMRESMIVFLNTVSFFQLLLWLKKGKMRNFLFTIILVLLSMILHSGALGLALAYGVIFSCYDTKKQKIHISGKAVLLLGLLVLFIIGTYLSPMRKYLMEYIPKVKNIYQLQDKIFVPGGSNYLTDMYTDNLFIFIIFTFVRCIYFWMSPMPWDWRGIGDIIAFNIDSFFHIILIIFPFFRYKKQKNMKILYIAILLCLFCSSLIFAWGVSNAGTAMRHRNKFIGLEAVLLGLCVKKRRA